MATEYRFEVLQAGEAIWELLSGWQTGTTLEDVDPTGWPTGSTQLRAQARNSDTLVTSAYSDIVTVTIAEEADTITVPFLASTAVLYAPSLVGGAATLVVPFLGSTATLYVPTVVPGSNPPVTIEPPLLASTSVLYPPAITVPTLNILPGNIYRVPAASGGAAV